MTENKLSNAEIFFISLSVISLGLCGVALLVMLFTDFTFAQSLGAIGGLLAVIAVFSAILGLLNKLPLGVLIGFFIGGRL